MRALGVNFVASWKVTFMNLSLVITATLTGGHCRGHEVVPDVVVVAAGCLLLGLTMRLVGWRPEEFCFEPHGRTGSVSSVFLKDERGLFQMFQ